MAERKNETDAYVPSVENASTTDAAYREEVATSRKKGDATTAGPTELTAVRASTGQRRATKSHEDLYDFVEVENLKRDYTFGPAGNQKTYGPSSVPIEIPDQLAAALGLAGKRKAQGLTRQEEKDAGVDKPEKHPTAYGSQKNQNFNAIPVSDPTREAPGQEEREAAYTAAGTTEEQINERRVAAGEIPPPPRERATSKGSK